MLLGHTADTGGLVGCPGLWQHEAKEASELTSSLLLPPRCGSICEPGTQKRAEDPGALQRDDMAITAKKKLAMF